LRNQLIIGFQLALFWVTTLSSTLSDGAKYLRSGRYGGSIEPISDEGDSLRKEQLLKRLLVVERGLHPEV
jgi:hypothetical protein